MSRPGHIAMMVGLAWFATGGILTAISYGLLAGAYLIFTIGIILVGIIPFAIGLWQFFAYEMKSSDKKANYHAEIELRALVRAMVSIAAADGKLDVAEVNSISRIYQDLMDHPIKRGMVTKVSETMIGKNYSIHDDLGLTQAEISITMKENIIQACYLVMVADGDASIEEIQRINEIATTLHVPTKRAIELVEELSKQDNTTTNSRKSATAHKGKQKG